MCLKLIVIDFWEGKERNQNKTRKLTLAYLILALVRSIKALHDGFPGISSPQNLIRSKLPLSIFNIENMRIHQSNQNFTFTCSPFRHHCSCMLTPRPLELTCHWTLSLDNNIKLWSNSINNLTQTGHNTRAARRARLRLRCWRTVARCMQAP